MNKWITLSFIWSVFLVVATGGFLIARIYNDFVVLDGMAWATGTLAGICVSGMVIMITIDIILENA